MLVRLIGLQRDLVFQPSARLVPPRPFGRALARIGESSRSIVAALMFASFSLAVKRARRILSRNSGSHSGSAAWSRFPQKLTALKPNPLEHQLHLLRWINGA